METVIDGYNLLLKVGRLAELLRSGQVQRSREMLIHMLRRSGRSDLAGATVVFDSNRLNPGAMPGPEGNSPRIRRAGAGQPGVMFSPPGSDADTAIKEYLEERAAAGATGRVRLVTSDRALAAYARQLGAQIETSEECAKVLVGHQRPRHGRRRKDEAPEPGKELAAPSDREVDAWLRYFGMSGDEPIEC